MKERECIFCRIIKKEIPVRLINETDNFIAMLDANPKAEGHTLIIPKFHYATLLDIPSNLAGEMLDLIKKLSKNPKLSNSFNLLVNNSPAAGQAIMHAHIHLIPRKEGDGLRSLA